jgi:hypothetical protein
VEDNHDGKMEPLFKMWKETLVFVLASFIFGVILGKMGF